MSDDRPYYLSERSRFTLFESPSRPAWRPPQLGALGALAAHWSLPRPVPALISLPTGTGKTAIAVAAAHLACGHRALVVVPSTELRRQMVAAFRTEEVIVRIDCLVRESGPEVLEVTGRVMEWERLEAADVVVALPHSISPVHYPDNPPPDALFDLVIVDEAHHAPAPTWRAIVDHFSSARAVLLTATPQRRDGQRLPGKHIYHYPLRQALDEGIFKVIQPRILDILSTCDRAAVDNQIAEEVATVLSEPAHATSTLLVRAANRGRAADLARLYGDRGISVKVLHSGLSRSTQESIVEALRTGEQRGVVVIGMLIEGFDLPSLRIVAYHDKHKSLPATAQLIGRLARVDDQFPQASVLVTARDIDVFPELQGVVRELYDEDPDWGLLLPGIIDDQIAEAMANREYIQTFSAPPPALSLESVHPIRRSVIFEIPPGSDRPTVFIEGGLPPDLEPGRLLRGNIVLYADLNQDTNMLLVVTTAIARPRWHNDPGLDSATYELHVLSYREPARAELPSLILLNTSNQAIGREVLKILGVDESVRSADPTRLQEAFDSLERLSVSSVGVRNTYPGRGTPSYRILAGSGVDRGLRETDTAFGALGHAMVQIAGDGSAFTAGVSTGKGKYWETRYVPLREYDTFVTGLAERYWFPPITLTGQLLPQISRGKRLIAWPTIEPLVAELDYALIGAGWEVAEIGPLESLELRALPAGSAGIPNVLPLVLVNMLVDEQPVVWQGYQDLLGNIAAVEADLTIRRGFAGPALLADLLSARPPTVFFIDGTVVHGQVIFSGRTTTRRLPPGLLNEWDWPDVDIGAETRATAEKRGQGRSVHEALEERLAADNRRARHRWILSNDGAGELADYIVLEVEGNQVFVNLWHAKFAHGRDPSVRVTDLEEVVAQAIKSRRWITDVGFWEELGARLNGRARPQLKIVEGHVRLLNVLCGEIDRWERLSLRRSRPVVTGRIMIVQPGLKRSALEQELALATPSLAAMQSRDLLAVFHDSVSRVADVGVICSP